MIYGVPQLGRDHKTKRVKHISCDAETFQDELLLTLLEKAFKDDGVEYIVFVMKNGKNVAFPIEKVA